MKRRILTFSSLLLLICTVFIQASAFRYVHDPRKNPCAMKDIVEDESAIYGFRPSETGSLKAYASADWSDPAVVEAGRQDRIAYHNSINSMYDMLKEYEKAGKSVEEIAQKAGMEPDKTMIILTKLEIEGLAKETAPGYFVKKLELA